MFLQGTKEPQCFSFGSMSVVIWWFSCMSRLRVFAWVFLRIVAGYGFDATFTLPLVGAV